MLAALDCKARNKLPSLEFLAVAESPDIRERFEGRTACPQSLRKMTRPSQPVIMARLMAKKP